MQAKSFPFDSNEEKIFSGVTHPKDDVKEETAIRTAS